MMHRKSSPGSDQRGGLRSRLDESSVADHICRAKEPTHRANIFSVSRTNVPMCLFPTRSFDQLEFRAAFPQCGTNPVFNVI
jgi:hypothetical protein